MDRISEIKEKVNLWLEFKLIASTNDLMPDIIYLLEKLDEYSKNTSR